MKNLLDYLPLINILGFAILAIATFYYNARSGKSKIGDEVLSLYEKNIDALKEDVSRSRDANHDVKNQMTTLTLRLGQLEGQLKEKDLRITELMAIIENRNPELENILREIRDFMKMIHKQTSTNEKRNVKIDHNTADEVGNVMRSKES